MANLKDMPTKQITEWKVDFLECECPATEEVYSPVLYMVKLEFNCWDCASDKFQVGLSGIRNEAVIMDNLNCNI